MREAEAANSWVSQRINQIGIVGIFINSGRRHVRKEHRSTNRTHLIRVRGTRQRAASYNNKFDNILFEPRKKLSVCIAIKK